MRHAGATAARVIGGAFAFLAVLGAGAASGQGRLDVTPVAVTARNAFVPSIVVVPAGWRLEYANLDLGMHSLTADALDPVTGLPAFDSGLRGVGQSGEVVGVPDLAPSIDGYGFHCSLHPSMTGTLIVLEPDELGS
jgi:plastocyanin